MPQAEQKIGKEERLKSRKLISELFDNGQVFFSHPFKVLYKIDSFKNRKPPVKIAISVSKKNFRLAVSRNRIKRKVRESYRQNKYLLYNNLESLDKNLNVFVIYTTTEDMDYTAIELAMKALLNKLASKLDKL